MDYVLGTLQNGRIVFDERPDWPEGQRVAVLPHLDGEPVGTIQPGVQLPDGRQVSFNGSPEHFKLLADQMDRAEPWVMTPEEEAEWKQMLQWIGDYTVDAVRTQMKSDK